MMMEDETSEREAGSDGEPEAEGSVRSGDFEMSYEEDGE